MTIRTLSREELLAECHRIVQEHYDIDIELSLRGVYYALVGEGLIKPDAKEGEGSAADRRRNYRRIGETIVEAKEAGDFPLGWLRDELRIPKEGQITACSVDVTHGEREAAEWLRNLPEWAIEVDRWYGQPKLVLLVVEKDALVGTVKRPVEDLKVPFFCLRGYPSWTGVYSWFEQVAELAEAVEEWETPPEETVVLYVGDHDPDGVFIPEAMQNIVASMEVSTGRDLLPNMRWERVALTAEQALDIGAPSMGVKMSSSRAPRYVRKFGHDAWETEAMPARQLRALVEDTIRGHFDQGTYRLWQRVAARRREELIERMNEPGWLDRAMNGEI